MKRVIATLPLSPRQDPVLGYCLTAFAAHIFGSLTGLSSLVALNTKGAKGLSVRDADAFTNLLSRIIETPFYIWHDEAQKWAECLTTFSVRGLQEGWLTIEQRETHCCDCGKVEFLPEPLNLVQNDFRRKTYEIQNGMIHCRLCKTIAQLKTSTCLLMQLPRTLVPVACVPNYAQLEWGGLIRQLCGCKLLVSRTRDTGLPVQIGSSTFFFDVDLCWMLMPFLLMQEEFEVDTLVCGHKTLKHAFLTVAVSQLMNIREPSTIIAVPYLHVRDIELVELSAEKLLEMYGANTLRVSLAMALGGSGKELTLLEQDLRFADYAMQRFCSTVPVNKFASLKYAWSSLGLQRIRHALAQVRRGHTDHLTMEMRQILSILSRHSV